HADVGLAAAVLVIVGACVVATRGRPGRAAAPVAGVGCVGGVRAATAPLVARWFGGVAVGLGVCVSLGALAPVAAAWAVRVRWRGREDRPPGVIRAPNTRSGRHSFVAV